MRAASASASAACSASVAALLSASAVTSSAPCADSISVCACARRVCSALSSGHSWSPGARRSTSPICQTRRSRSRSISALCERARSSAAVVLFHCVHKAASGARSNSASLSSSARTAAGRVRLCHACWPWMSTNSSAASRNCVTVAGLPLIQARLLPCASIVRRSSSVSLASKPASSSQGASTAGASNSAAISAREAPSRTTSTSPREPKASCSASIRIDLPAPVSPVSTEKPAPNSTSSSGTMTKSRNDKRLSTYTTPSYQRNFLRNVA
jgi:hypothetical protein